MDDHIIKPASNLSNQNSNTKSLTHLIKYPIIYSAKKTNNKHSNSERTPIKNETNNKFDILPIISYFGKFEPRPIPIINLKKTKKIGESIKINDPKDSPYNIVKDKSHAIVARLAEMNKKNVKNMNFFKF